MVARSFLTVALAVGCAVAFTTTAQDAYRPGETSVAIVPVANVSASSNEALKKNQCDRGDTFLREQFKARGFNLVPVETVNQAITDMHLDMSDDEQYRRQTFFDLGKKLNADLIVVAVIVDTRHPNEAQGNGFATMRVWLLDVKRETAILGGKRFEGKSGASLDRGTAQQIRAVSNGLRDAFADFFSKYPEINK